VYVYGDYPTLITKRIKINERKPLNIEYTVVEKEMILEQVKGPQ